MKTHRDAYAGFNFTVELADTGRTFAGFSEVSGLAPRVDVAHYRDGTFPPLPVQKIVPVRKAGEVTLKRGVAHAGEISAWLDSTALDVRIILRDEKRAAVQTWVVHQAVICKHTAPTLSAKGTDVAMEELVLAAESISPA